MYLDQIYHKLPPLSPTGTSTFLPPHYLHNFFQMIMPAVVLNDLIGLSHVSISIATMAAGSSLLQCPCQDYSVSQHSYPFSEISFYLFFLLQCSLILSGVDKDPTFRDEYIWVTSTYHFNQFESLVLLHIAKDNLSGREQELLYEYKHAYIEGSLSTCSLSKTTVFGLPLGPLTFLSTCFLSGL